VYTCNILKKYTSITAKVTVTFVKHKYHMLVMLCKRITCKIVGKNAITFSVVDEKKMCKVVFFSK